RSCSSFVFLFSCSVDHRDLHSFPTRRSSDLAVLDRGEVVEILLDRVVENLPLAAIVGEADGLDVLLGRMGDDLADVGLVVLGQRSEEHTSELQSRENLVCRLLLEKKKTKTHT